MNLPELYPHQEIIDKLFLKYSAGLGKTFGALNLINKRFKDVKNLVVICPLVIVEQWEKILKEVEVDYNYIVIHPQGMISKKNNEITFTEKWETINNYIEDTVVIIDEAHIGFRAKPNKKSKVTQRSTVLNYTCKLPKNHVLLLTATPIGENIDTVYMIESLAHSYYKTKEGNSLNSLYKFKEYFLEKEIVKLRSRQFIKYNDLKPHLNDFFLEQFNNKWQTVTYETAKVTMPFKNFSQPIYCELDVKSKIAYDNLKEGLLVLLNNDQIPLPLKLTRIQKVRQFLSGFVYVDDEPKLMYDFKLKSLLKFLDTYCFKANEKFILYDSFIPSRLNTFNILHAKYNDKVVLLNNQQDITEVQAKFKDKALLLVTSAKLSGIGLNLQFCSNAIFFNQVGKIDREQAEGRIYRIGSMNNVNYYDCVALDTIDMQDYNKTLHKLNDSQLIEEILCNLSKK